MVTYNPKEWWKLIFYIHKTDTFVKLLPSMIAIMIYTAVFYIVEIRLLHLPPVKSPIALHSLVGFVLSLLLVFRTNTAYDRWWEGRKLWGSFTNNSRNLAIKLKTFLPNGHEDLKFFEIQIGNYLQAVKDNLRDDSSIMHLTFHEGFNSEDLENSKHIPNVIFMGIMNRINDLYKNNIISGDQLIVLNNELSSFSDNTGACERIKNTPIPASYNIFIKKMIFLYVLTMPFSFVMEFGAGAIFIVTIVFYAFAGIEIIAEEIENPFGTDNNDLALDSILKKIKINLEEIMS